MAWIYDLGWRCRYISWSEQVSRKFLYTEALRHTCAHATYGAIMNSTFRCLKTLKTILQRSHCAKLLLPSKSLVAASSWPASYLAHAWLLSLHASLCSEWLLGFQRLLGMSPGNTNTGFIRSFSRARKSDSMRWVSAKGNPPVAASRGSREGALSVNN